MKNTSLFYFWVFIYQVFIGFIFHFLVLGYLFPHLNLGYGFIYLDSVSFQSMALEQYKAFQSSGWSSYLLLPHGHLPSGIASFFYNLFHTSESWILIPIQAFINTLACIIIKNLLKTAGCSEFSTKIASILPALLPSQVLVFAQLHRDLYFAISFWWFLSLLFQVQFRRFSFFIFLKIFLAICLTFLTRDYLLMPLILALFFIQLFFLISTKKSIQEWLNQGIWMALVIGIFLLADHGMTALKSSTMSSPMVGGHPPTLEIGWRPTRFIPQVIDHQFKNLAIKRYNWIDYVHEGDASTGDSLKLQSSREVIQYLPKATLTSLCAPFPSFWFAHQNSSGKILRVLSGFEMMFYYLCLIGLGMGMMFGRVNEKGWALSIFLLSFLILMGVVTPNMGTLFRLRIGFYLPLICLGFANLVYKTRKGTK